MTEKSRIRFALWVLAVRPDHRIRLKNLGCLGNGAWWLLRSEQAVEIACMNTGRLDDLYKVDLQNRRESVRGLPRGRLSEVVNCQL